MTLPMRLMCQKLIKVENPYVEERVSNVTNCELSNITKSKIALSQLPPNWAAVHENCKRDTFLKLTLLNNCYYNAPLCHKITKTLAYFP